MMGQLDATFGDNLAVLQYLAIKRGGQPFPEPLFSRANIIEYAAVEGFAVICVKIRGVNAHFCDFQRLVKLDLIEICCSMNQRTER